MNTGPSLIPQGFIFEGNDVRVTTGANGEPWFVAKDVCQLFGDSDHKRSIGRLDDDEKAMVDVVDALGRPQQATGVSEAGLYSVLFAMQPQKAQLGEGGNVPPHVSARVAKLKKFKKWVTAEVLPAIRKTGSYGQPAPARDPLAILNDPAAMRGLLLNYSEKVLALEATVTEQKPVVDAYDRLVTRTDGALCITDAAKHIQVRPKDLFAWLQRHNWIYRRPGGSAWLAYQSTLQRGYMEHKVVTITVDGHDRIREQALVTAKGLARLAVEFAKQEATK